MTIRALYPTPLFDTPHIPFTRLPLKKDDQGLIREVETIAFPGTKFKVIKEVSENMLQVSTSEYPADIYADRRFFKEVESNAPERVIDLPGSETTLQMLKSLVGTRYFWGGNWELGIPEMLDFYPELRQASLQDREDAICCGLDCSGLLYRVTNGYSPRNTSGLIQWGQNLPLQDLSPEQIQSQLKPLDLLVWRGHVVIVLTPSTVIESRGGAGVVISDFQKRYAEITELVKQQNKTLYFRRWHPDFLPKN